MRLPNIIYGLLTQKPTALGYLRKKKPVRLAGLIVFLCALISTIVVWYVFIYFGKTGVYYDLTLVMILLKSIFSYWIMNSVLLHFAIILFIKSQNLPKTKVSLRETLSYFGFLCPLYSFTYLIGMFPFVLPNILQFILLLPILALWLYMLIVYSNGIAELYQIPKKLPIILMSVIIILGMPNAPLATILGYARWP